MSDIEQLAEELNNQNPVDFDQLAEAFDTIFYQEPEGSKPVEAEHVDGMVIGTPSSVGDLVDKLQTAKEANPEFIQIGNREYTFDSKRGVSRLIDGIRIGFDANEQRD